MCKTIRKRLREDLREHNTMKVKEAIGSGNGLKNAKEKEDYKVLIPALREQNGTITTNRERILEDVQNCMKIYAKMQPRTSEKKRQRMYHQSPTGKLNMQ